jgi:predicted PurR-regulated permease PerM
MIRARLHRNSRPDDGPRDVGETVEIDAAELSGVFAAPSWLRDVGLTAWLLVGVTLLLAGAIWILSLVDTIVMPLIAAGVIAAVAAPVVRWLGARGLPRAAGTAVVFLGLVVLGVGLVVVIVAGITSQLSTSGRHLDDAKATIEAWLHDLGANATTARDAMSNASSMITKAASALLDGVASGIAALSSLAFFLAFTAISLLFLLKDGPLIRAWAERHAGVPVAVAHTVGERVLQSLRGYFVGVTIVAGFNAVVVGLGALALGVPLAGTIAVVTFLGAYCAAGRDKSARTPACRRRGS